MSGLRHKLDLLKRTSGVGVRPSTTGPAPQTAPSSGPLEGLRPGDERLLEALGGEFRSTAAGPLHITSHRYSLETPYGRHGCLLRALGLKPQILSPL